MALNGTIWHYMALYMALCETMWHCMALYGTVWHCMALCGTVWHCVALYEKIIANRQWPTQGPYNRSYWVGP